MKKQDEESTLHTEIFAALLAVDKAETEKTAAQAKCLLDRFERQLLEP